MAAEDYGDELLNGRVRVHPPSIDFVNVEPGIKYVVRVAVKNVSTHNERIRFITPPSGSGFVITARGTTTVAPGIEATTEAEFVLAEDQDYSSTLVVDVSGTKLEIPMEARRPRAELEVDTEINFGPVVHNNVVTRELIVHNRGRSAGRYSFDVRMIEVATGEEMAPMQAQDASAFTIHPAAGEVDAGERKVLKVQLDARSLGPARCLAHLEIRGGVGPSLVDLAAIVLMQRLELLDAKGVLMPPRLSFGNLFAGLDRSHKCTLVNNGPRPISFNIATLRDDDEPQELAENEELDRVKSDLVFDVHPPHGQLEPFGSLVVQFRFAPPPAPPTKAGFRSTRAELRSRPPPVFAVGKRVSVLETDQTIDVILEGTAVHPSVTLSRSTVQFAEPCKLYDHMDTTLTVRNSNAEMPVNFCFTKVANFLVQPSAGRLAPGSSREVVITFAPKQQGVVEKIITLDVFKGNVLSLPVRVSGVCQGTSGRRRLPGGPVALPGDFVRQPHFAHTTALPPDGGIAREALTRPVGEAAQRTKKPLWEQTEELDHTLATDLGSLAKKKTYAEQMSLQHALDRLEGQVTGFELSARQLAANASHRERYIGFLRTSHADRMAREQGRFVRPELNDLAAFELGVDMGMASLSARGVHPLEGGWSPEFPVLDLPLTRDPLWLDHAYNLEGEAADVSKGSKSRVLLFDDRKLIKRKHRPKPTTAEEVQHCNMSLTPKDLILVTGGPKVVDFGTISVLTTVRRSFNLANDLLTNVLVAVDAQEEEELRQSTPQSQVLPPNGIAGFDLVFCSPDVQSFRRTVSYTINDRYSYKFTCVAEVVPVDMELSTDEIRFVFEEGDLNPTLTMPVTLTNHGTYQAEFECRGPAVSAKRPVAFEVVPDKGVVDAGRSLEVHITFTPTPGAALEHMLTFVVEGGPSRTLLCRADMEEVRCSIDAKRVDFGLVAVGIAQERVVTLKNQGTERAVFYWDPLPDGLVISPMFDAIAPNGSADVILELSPAAPMKLDAPLTVHVRGGKPLRVHVSADAQLPQVGIVEDEFAFGTVTVGAKVSRRLTIVNTGALVALLDCLLTQTPFFDLTHTAPVRDAEEAGDEDDAEAPLQLLSLVEEAAAAEAAAAGHRARASGASRVIRSGGHRGGATTDDEDELRGEDEEVDDRDYRISVPAGTSLELTLTFEPAEVGSFEFELPIALTGLEAVPTLRRAVTADAVASRVVVTPLTLDMGACICRSALFPYDAEVLVQRVDSSPALLRWDIDTAPLPAGSLVAVDPTCGDLEPGEAVAVRVRFCPERPCALDGISLPLYLDGERRRPYLSIDLRGRGVQPRLTFDRSEVVLPSVPLGFTSMATFVVHNDGYDNLDLSHKLPADSAKVPLQLYYPEGNMIGIAKQDLPLVLTFTAKKPMSFTAKVYLVDKEGQRYPIQVSGTTDNSVLSVQPWLSQYGDRHEIVIPPGRPPMMLSKEQVDLAASAAKGDRRGSQQAQKQRRPSEGKVATASAQPSLHSSTLDARGPANAPPPKSEWPTTREELSAAVAEAEGEAAVLLPWIKSFLLDLPSQKPFPGSLIATRGRALIDILEAVSGKNLAMNIPREVQSVINRPPKSRAALSRALWKQYDVLITFMKQHGALLGPLRAEELLSRDDYVRWHAWQRKQAARAAAGKPEETAVAAGEGVAVQGKDGRAVEAKLSDVEKRELLSRFKLVSTRAWCNLFYQLIKVFFASRITPKAFRSTPGVADLLERNDAFEETLAGSNIYTVAEGILLHWVTLHWRKAAPDKAKGVMSRIVTYDQLRDGHVLAALILSHAPFAAPMEEEESTVDNADNSFGTATDEAEKPLVPRERKPGSAITALHPMPCDDKASAQNVRICIETLASSLAIDRPPAAEIFTNGSHRDILLALIGLYHTLPHYVPKTTIDFAGALHEQITKSIELSNPSRRPIQYTVRVEGSRAFELPLGKFVRIEPKSTLSFPVVFASRFAADAEARLLFLSRGDGASVAHATSLTFVLSARITSKKPHSTLSMESPLYQMKETEVTVTNPFEETCSFSISVSEVKPPLDRDGVATGAPGAPSGCGTSVAQATVRAPGAAPSAASASATGAAAAGAGGLVGSAAEAKQVAKDIVANQRPAPSKVVELEKALTRLPDAFHIASSDPRKPETRVTLAPGTSTVVRLQFLPFMLGEHKGEISFLDERRGEFVYAVTGQGTLPQPLETLHLKADAETSATLEVAVPFRNEALERARTDALKRLAKVRDKDLERTRAPLRQAPLFFKLEFSGPFFTGPPTAELIDTDAKGRRRGGAGSNAGSNNSYGSTAAASKLQSAIATPVDPDSGLGTAREQPTDNLLIITFVPRQAGLYTSKLVLYSPLDVRVFDLAGTAPAPGTRATLEFTAPARRVVKQEIPIVNNTEQPWDLTAEVNGEYFRGATSLRVLSGTTEAYVLEFAPEWMCRMTGELQLLNVTTGDKFAYALVGVGEEPLAEGTVVIEVQARSQAKHEFGVFNMSEDGKECACAVESDLMHVSGEPVIKVPARVGGVPFGPQTWGSNGQSRRPSLVASGPTADRRVSNASRRSSTARAPPAKYTLAISPQLGGNVHGSLTFKAPDGRYLWYTVEIRAAPPPAERTIEVEAHVRAATALEVEVVNPLADAVEFAVELEGDGLLGEPRLTVGPGPDSAAKYELVFSPLVAGVYSGAVSFLNPAVGEFWYKLLLTAHQPPPEEPPLMECELCKTVEHVARVDNPLGEAVALRSVCSNLRNFKVGTKGGGPLTLPPYGSLDVVMQYSPSALAEEQTAEVQLTHPRLADWVYRLRGMGLRPTTMPPTAVCAELHSVTSGSVTFTNPFDKPISVSVHMNTEGAREGVFALLMRRTTAIVVAPSTQLQVSFTFEAADMHEHNATVRIVVDDDPQLTWAFPVVAFAESLPATKPFVLSLRARQQLQTVLELPLNGLDEGFVDATFSAQLEDVPAEHERPLASSLRLEVAGPLTPESFLPVAVRWMPLRPLKAHVSLVVRQERGGRWKYDMTLQAASPEVDDIILMESTLNRTASVSFNLTNTFAADAEFTANFTAESPTVFAVRPSSGVLPRAGSDGQPFVVSFTPYEYGKMAIGVLVITTAEMQWSYEVRGQPPAFVLPVARKRIDDKIDPAIARRLEHDRHVSQHTNFMKRNMQVSQR